MKTNKKPKMLVHFSTSEIDAFTGAIGNFTVNTQGRVYALDIDAKFANTSLAHTPRCALVFTDDSLKHFHKHPWEIIHCWKRPTAQYRTIKLGDISWSNTDTVHVDKDILQIKKIERIKNNNIPRIKWQKIKVLTVHLLNWFAALIIFSCIANILSVELDIYPGKISELASLVFMPLLDAIAPPESDLKALVNCAKEHLLPFIPAGAILCISTLIYTHYKTKKNTSLFLDKIKKIKLS